MKTLLKSAKVNCKYNNKGEKTMNEPNYKDIAIELNEKHNHLVVEDKLREKPTSFIYNDESGNYERYSINRLQKIVSDELSRRFPSYCRTSVINEIVKFMQMYAPQKEFTDFDSEQDLILFANGVLNIKTLELLPHNPKYLFTRKNAARYIKIDHTNLPTKTIEYFNNLSGGNKGINILLWEILGLVISNVPGYMAKKLIILFGPGNSGKSVYRNLLTALVGEEFNSGCTLEQMNSRFGLSSIYNKRVVGSADMPFQSNQSISQIKTLTGGDNIDIEFKGLTSFSGKFNGVLCFCTNELPLFSGDKGKHVYERFIPIKCDNVVPNEKRNANLLSEILEERDAIASFAVECLKQFIDNGYQFHIPPDVEKIIERYRLDNSPEIQFYNEECVLESDKNACMTRTQVFQAFKDYCKDNFPRYIPNKNEFVRILSDYLGKDIEDRIPSKRIYIFTVKAY